MTRCPKCQADLGPAEDPAGCITCTGRRPMTADARILAVLEQSPGPLAYWDIQRLLAKDPAPRLLADATITQTLGWSHRFCWAGKGLYGLYRHGLLPGPRGLSAVAGVFVHAGDRSMTLDELQFVLRNVGYRFAPGSLEPALWRDTSGNMFTSGRERRGSESVWAYSSTRSNLRQARAAAEAMRFLRRGPDVYATLDRAGRQVDAALRLRQTRLSST
ncbi:MAG: hypothetical protein WKF96_05930 [Solirubrobacteraceae bacterium]